MSYRWYTIKTIRFSCDHHLFIFIFSVGHKISSLWIQLPTHELATTNPGESDCLHSLAPRCTCTDSPNYTCGDASHGGFYCVDPNSGCQDATNAPTSTPDPGKELTTPDCFGTRDFIGDGYCDENNNNEGCEYDGGDCCSWVTVWAHPTV